MNLKLIKDGIFPNCINKTEHKVVENNSYFCKFLNNRYMVFYERSSGVYVMVASYISRREMNLNFR